MVLSLEAAGQSLTSLREIGRAAGISPGFARKLAHGLVEKGWLQRARRGEFLLNPSRHGPDALPNLDPLRLGAFLVTPYYYGYGTAAELHGLLRQAGRVYYIVTPKRLASRRLGTSELRPIRLTPSHFFGATHVVRRGLDLMVSDLERTVLDCVSRPDFSGGVSGVAHAVALAKPRLNWTRLGTYIRRYGNASLGRRIGYLTERLRPSTPVPARFLDRLLPRLSDPFSPLVTSRRYGRRGSHDARWHIIRNLDERELYAEGEIP